MIYQQFINYPNLTVYENIASPLRLAKMKESEIDRRVKETANMLQIDPLLKRYPLELSGATAAHGDGQGPGQGRDPDPV